MKKTFVLVMVGTIGVGTTHNIEKNTGAGLVVEPMWWVGGSVAEPMWCWSNVISDSTLALNRAQLGFRIQVGAKCGKNMARI